jgi:hypothetical protein
MVIECAYRKCLEAAIPLTAAGFKPGDELRFQFSLWERGLPAGAVPYQGDTDTHSAAGGGGAR